MLLNYRNAPIAQATNHQLWQWDQQALGEEFLPMILDPELTKAMEQRFKDQLYGNYGWALYGFRNTAGATA